MTQDKKSNAKALHSHGQEDSTLGNKSSPALSAMGMTTKLPQVLSDDVTRTRYHHKKPSVGSTAKDGTIANKKSAHLATTHKRSRQDEITSSDDQPPSSKKSKRDQQEQPQKVDPVPTLAQNGEKNPMQNTRALETTLQHTAKQPAPQIPNEVRHLTSKYDLIPMSIISSSKMEQKVRNVLERVSKFSFGDAKGKPGVVILHAEARNANKMVTIAEVSKKNVEKDKGTWWQYTKLEGQVMEMKEKPRRPSPPAQSGKTLAKWEDEQRNTPAAVEDHADIAMGGTRVEPAVDEQAEQTAPPQKEEEEEEGEAFETMSAPTNGHRRPSQPDKRVRAVPIMTIYLARVPVPGLRDLYGEQTNSLAP